jgi:IS5 family transposase
MGLDDACIHDVDFARIVSFANRTKQENRLAIVGFIVVVSLNLRIVSWSETIQDHALPHLLHGNEKRAYGDNAYAGQKELIHSKAPQAKDFMNEQVRRRKDEPADEIKRAKNRNKSRIRARVEHVFAVVKRLWGFAKVRYRGLAKNACRALPALALALANIYLTRHRLMAQGAPVMGKAGGNAR